MATLKLKEENIYADGYIVNLDEERKLLKSNPLSYTPSAANDIGYILKEEEKLWDVAFRFYGNSKWWFVLAEVNNIFNPFEIPMGTNLIIPDIDVIRASRK